MQLFALSFQMLEGAASAVMSTMRVAARRHTPGTGWDALRSSDLYKQIETAGCLEILDESIDY